MSSILRIFVMEASLITVLERIKLGDDEISDVYNYLIFDLPFLSSLFPTIGFESSLLLFDSLASDCSFRQ